MYCFLVADLGILSIFTRLAIGMAFCTVLNSLDRVYISTTLLTRMGKESLLLLESLDISAFIESNHSVVRPRKKCDKLDKDSNASTASALVAAT
jgi:hypothetical protein